eukprot:211342-Prorocentrum_minimum.AAC.4
MPCEWLANGWGRRGGGVPVAADGAEIAQSARARPPPAPPVGVQGGGIAGRRHRAGNATIELK